MTIVSTATQADQDTAHYQDILRTLIDQGAAIAARVHASAIAATTPGSALPEATIAFDRIARTVRHTIGLARHIASAAATAATAHAAAARPGITRTTARAKLIRGVEDAIYRKRQDRDTEALTSELHERLEDPVLELDLQDRSIEDLIEEISRDLGVAQQDRSYVYKRRTPKDIQDLRTRAGHDGPRASDPRSPSQHLAHRSGPNPPRQSARP